MIVTLVYLILQSVTLKVSRVSCISTTQISALLDTGSDIFSMVGCDNSAMFQVDIYYKLSHAIVISPDTLSDRIPHQTNLN